jgi:DNA polymerase-3 subunit epsilon
LTYVVLVALRRRSLPKDYDVGWSTPGVTSESPARIVELGPVAGRNWAWGGLSDPAGTFVCMAHLQLPTDGFYLPPECSDGFAVIDVETSHLDPGAGRVLQIGAVLVDRHGVAGEEWTTLVDGGCDPGRTDIHGITREMLVGAPKFVDVVPELFARLERRLFVAHNAQFDWRFLAAEARRAGLELPTAQRLCTLTLTRRLELPVPNAKLPTVARHYGVRQVRAHDALDDARVAAGVLSHLLADAARSFTPVPFVDCRAESVPAVYRPRPPKVPCPWAYPGRAVAGEPLVQGMKVAITGETRVPREELVARAAATGLEVTGSVSRRTSLLVANDAASGTAKAVRATAEGTLVVTEAAFVRLLQDVRRGTSKATPVPRPAVDKAPKKAPAPTVAPSVDAAQLPLHGQRILVIGRPHEDAAALRARVSELGGAAAVNYSKSVNAVVFLPTAVNDPRLERARAVGVACQTADTFLAQLTDSSPEESAHTTKPVAATAPGAQPAHVLVRGAVVDLPDASGPWAIGSRWGWDAGEVDVVAFCVDEDEQVRDDADFVFFNQPATPEGAVSLGVDGPAEQTIYVDLERLPADVERIVIAAAVSSGSTFGAVGPIELAVRPAGGEALVTATLDAATSEQTLVLAEVYRRGDVWRLRAVGQGYDFGLNVLAETFGVEVDG